MDDNKLERKDDFVQNNWEGGGGEGREGKVGGTYQQEEKDKATKEGAKF